MCNKYINGLKLILELRTEYFPKINFNDERVVYFMAFVQRTIFLDSILCHIEKDVPRQSQVGRGFRGSEESSSTQSLTLFLREFPLP